MNRSLDEKSLRLATIADLEEFKRQFFEEFRRVIGAGQSKPQKSWLKSSDVRKMLGISAGKLQTMRSCRQITFTRIGGVIYYEQSEIEQMLFQAKVERR